MPFTARYDADPWILKLAVPWIRITGATGVVPGVGRVDTQGARQSASGLGDIVGSATYAAYYDAAARAGFDVTAKLKLATAERDRGMGTGEHDVAFFVEPFTPLGRWTLFGALGYHVLGSSPAIPLHDVWSASAGLSLPLEARSSVGVSLDTRQAPSASASPQRELMGFWLARIDRWRLQAYLLLGLADGSPDQGAGVSLALPF